MRQRNIIKRTPAQQAYMAAVRQNNHGEATFLTRWLQHAANIPFPFQRQSMFHPGRNWRFDFFDPLTLTAVEVSGGAHIAGLERLAADFEKINAAMEDGIAVLHYTPDQVEYQPERVIGQVLRVLEKRREGR